MIDHLIRCATQEDAETLVRQFGRSRAHTCRVILQDAEWDVSDDPENPVLVTPEIVAEGHHVWVALDALDESLRGLPENACRLIADRDAALAGQPFLLHQAPDIPPETMATARIVPVPAGSGYPFREETS